MYSLIKSGDFFSNLDIWMNMDIFNSDTRNGRVAKILRKETETACILKAELPGYSDQDVKIEIKNNILSISGKQEKKCKFSSSVKSFSESFYLNDQHDTQNITAELQSGVLIVNIPKLKSPTIESRLIPIKT